jgi:hypothetical protein
VALDVVGEDGDDREADEERGTDHSAEATGGSDDALQDFCHDDSLPRVDSRCAMRWLKRLTIFGRHLLEILGTIVRITILLHEHKLLRQKEGLEPELLKCDKKDPCAFIRPVDDNLSLSRLCSMGKYSILAKDVKQMRFSCRGGVEESFACDSTEKPG